MRGTQKDERKWALVKALLELNPNVTHARIGRAVGYKGQTVGIIARELGFPTRGPGGFQKKDETPLIYPPENAPGLSPEPEKAEADGA